MQVEPRWRLDGDQLAFDADEVLLGGVVQGALDVDHLCGGILLELRLNTLRRRAGLGVERKL